MDDKLVANITPPFAMTDGELEGIGRFAHANGLDEILKLVAELRALRKAHIEQVRIIGILRGQLEPDPSKRFSKEMDRITNATPKS